MNKELLLIYEIASFAIGIILLYVTEKSHVGQYLTKMPPKELLEKKLSLAIANAREQLEQRV